jgi:hypothetical protein
VISFDDIKLTASDTIAFNTKKLEIKNLKKSSNVESNDRKSYQVSNPSIFLFFLCG